MKQPTASNPRPAPEMIEGQKAFENFQNAVRTVLTVPKSAVPSPFGNRAPKDKKPVTRKG
jgi:hypothetical protein